MSPLLKAAEALHGGVMCPGTAKLETKYKWGHILCSWCTFTVARSSQSNTTHETDYATPPCQGNVQFLLIYMMQEPDTITLCHRNKDFQEVSLEKDGVVLLCFASAYGFRNIQNLVQKLKRGKSPYHFVEVMACPSGEVKNADVQLSRYLFFFFFFPSCEPLNFWPIRIGGYPHKRLNCYLSTIIFTCKLATLSNKLVRMF